MASDFTLYIGYRHVSSWSLRAWMAMRKTGAPFEERMIRYRRPEDKRELVAASPTGKVPLLVHRRGREEIKVWESLAIGEYLAEFFHSRSLWPRDPAARAFARSIATEMHSGFRPLRDKLGMELLKTLPSGAPYSPEVTADIKRIESIWREARSVWGEADDGPYLFGHFTVADAMYMPVATRFRTYGVTLEPTAEAYKQALLADADFQVWEAQARIDPEPEPLVTP
jgi:glutathione S-transferase